MTFNTEEWFEKILWPTYPRDLINRIGSKPKALTIVKSKIKTEEMAETVIAGIREQIRYYRKLKATGAHESKWKLPMLTTYLNGEHWGDEIPSHYELKQSIEEKKCACGKDATWQNLCWGCYFKEHGDKDWREQAIWNYFVKNNLAQQPQESREQWINRLKTNAREGFRQIG